MSKLKIPAALLVITAMSLGAPAIAAPVTASAAAKPMAPEGDLVQVRYGGWHGGHGFPAAAFAGALIGGALAAAPYYGGGYYRSYDNAYGYAPDDAYGYAPLPYRDPAPYYGTRPGYYRGCYPHCGWGG
jgi:hypothetical protein